MLYINNPIETPKKKIFISTFTVKFSSVFSFQFFFFFSVDLES